MNDFLETLSKTRDQIKWYTEYGMIRGKINDRMNMCVCPITAAYYIDTGIFVQSTNIYHACGYVRDKYRICTYEVVMAADKKGGRYDECRKSLLLAVGLDV